MLEAPESDGDITGGEEDEGGAGEGGGGRGVKGRCIISFKFCEKDSSRAYWIPMVPLCIHT